MRCHYEVLEVPRDADEDELKKQYRKLALKWHPDKNTSNMEEATEMFKELRAAYTVLSNPNERKWYDDHRQAILRGEGDADDDDDDDDDLDINIWPYFNSSCYSGEPDSDNGFYTVYNDLFVKLDEKEKEYATYNAKNKRSGKNDREVRPMFGTSTTSDDHVAEFYRYWRDFSSCLSFAELDKYDTNEEGIPRHIRRAMERENNKHRQSGRKEYVESIRQLVEFIRKLDERAIRVEKEARDRRRREKVALEVRRAQEIAVKQEERERRVEQFASNPEEIMRTEEERRRAFLLDNDYDDVEFFSYTVQETPVDSTNSSSSSAAASAPAIMTDADGNQVFRCELCDKSYGTEKQLVQHNGSRNHHMKDKDRRQQNKGRKAGADAKAKKVDIASVIDSVINGGDATNTGLGAGVKPPAESFVSRRGKKDKKGKNTVSEQQQQQQLQTEDDGEDDEDDVVVNATVTSVFQLSVDEEAEEFEDE
mgnify:CR=1 FL=1